MKTTMLALIIAVLISPVVCAAQEPTATPIPPGLPAEVRLEGLQVRWQQYNRCASAALYMQMSYFGYSGGATDIVTWLNPYKEDKSVRLEEMIAFAGEHDLLGIERTGGTRELMQRLVAGGFPVLVENAYYHRGGPNDWLSHNRVLMGYDTYRFYFFDPLLGPGDDNRGYGIRYDEFDTIWRDFNRVYMVLYRPDDQERLAAILGDQWDVNYNAQWTLDQAQVDYQKNSDAMSLYNVGSARLALGDQDGALQAFDGTRKGGLPWRLHWYRFEALEAYLQAGRYEDLMALIYKVIADTDAIQEVYYYAGLAYEAQGNTERARANYYAALDRNANYPAAQAALDRLDEGG